MKASFQLEHPEDIASFRRIKPFPPWPVFGTEEMDAVAAVLRSGQVNYWTGGEGRSFEQEFAAFVGTRHALTLANGTVALELALHTADVQYDNHVIVPARTFVATAGAVALRGARPVFADVDPHTQTLTAETVAQVLTPRTRAIIVVHLAGHPCDMDPVMDLAERHHLTVIEDCAQAHGARYKGRSVGSIGHVAAWSFCQDKIMTTGGEGGMLTTDDDEIWEQAWSYRDHGKNRAVISEPDPTPGFRWVHDSLGSNLRMTEMQSAIGRSLLRKLPAWVETRRRHAAYLNRRFAVLPALRLTLPSSDIYHSYYKYYVFVRPDRLKPGWTRDRILAEIQELGIPCYEGSCSEVYLEAAFAHLNVQPASHRPVARQLGQTALMFLVHPTLTGQDVVDIADVASAIVSKASA